MKTSRATIAYHPEPPNETARVTPLPAGYRVHYCYPAAGQDGLDDYAVCELANGQLVAIFADDLTNDDGSQFRIPSRFNGEEAA